MSRLVSFQNILDDLQDKIEPKEIVVEKNYTYLKKSNLYQLWKMKISLKSSKNI